MGVFDRQVATALRLISKNGQAVTWRSLVNGAPVDANKPWKPSAATGTEHSVKIVFLPRKEQNEKSIQYMEKSEVPTGLLKGLMGQVDFVPKLKDVIIRGSLQYEVETIDIIDPNGEGVILYTIELGAPNTVS